MPYNQGVAEFAFCVWHVIGGSVGLVLFPGKPTAVGSDGVVTSDAFIYRSIFHFVKHYIKKIGEPIDKTGKDSKSLCRE